MSEDMHEKLSTFMDGESDHPGDEIINWLSHDEAARKTWWRYHIISDVIGKNIDACADTQLADRIAERLHTEPALLIPSRNKTSRYLKPLAGLAIAATVATIAILGVRWNTGQDIEATSISHPVAVVQKPIAMPKPTLATTTSTAQFPLPRSARLTSAEANNRMNAYLLNYYEYRTMGAGMQGVNPYMRIIANDPEKE
jgi:negative regulator of sigma E activity